VATDAGQPQDRLRMLAAPVGLEVVHRHPGPALEERHRLDHGRTIPAGRRPLSAPGDDLGATPHALTGSAPERSIGAPWRPRHADESSTPTVTCWSRPTPGCVTWI